MRLRNFNITNEETYVLQNLPSGLPWLFLSLPLCKRGKFRNRNAEETSQGTRDYFGWGQRLRSVYKAWSASHESWNPAKHDTHAAQREQKPAGTRAACVSWIMIYEIRATRIHLATACLPCSPMQFVGTSPRYSINNTRHAHLSLENNLGPRGCCTHRPSRTGCPNDYELAGKVNVIAMQLKLDTRANQCHTIFSYSLLFCYTDH